MIKVKVVDPIIIPVEMQKTNAKNVDVENSIAYITNPDYRALKNKPAINGCILEGNKTCNDIDICSIENTELEKIINSMV